MAIPALSRSPRHTTATKLARARSLALSGNHATLKSVAEAVGLHESTLRSYGVTVRPRPSVVSDLNTASVLPPTLAIPAVADHPDPDGPAVPQRRTVEESRRLLKTRIGGAGYFKTYNGDGDQATLRRRGLRRLINERLALTSKRVSAYPQQTYDPDLDQIQRDMTDCFTAASILSNSKRPYKARHIERVANEFRRTKLGANAPAVSQAAVVETVVREQSKRT